MKGKVKWFNKDKGFGFILTEEGKDVFVHYTGIAKNGFRSLAEGQDVIFELAEGKKGLQAIDVRTEE